MIAAKIVVQKGLAEKFEKMAQMFPGKLEMQMRQSMVMLARHIKSNLLTGQVLKVRSGALRRSIAWDVEGKGKTITGAVGTNMIYAKIHEYGGVIRPRRRQWLTVPLPAALTAAGVSRGRARDFDNTFIRNHVIFQRRGARVVPLFVLKKQVTIPKRPYMSRGLREKRSAIVERLRMAVKEVLP